MTVATPEGRSELLALYGDVLLGDVIPFWLRHGLDREHGGYLTALDRDGTGIDTTALWRPFHLSRMLWYCWKLLDRSNHLADQAGTGENAEAARPTSARR